MDEGAEERDRMRTITTHHTNEANKAITVEVVEDENGEPHKYHLSANGDEQACLSFQWGPIKTHGVNGITNEVLLAIVADRLEYFQRGPFACVENAAALASVKNAANALESRTRGREARGVEGTHTP